MMWLRKYCLVVLLGCAWVEAVFAAPETVFVVTDLRHGATKFVEGRIEKVGLLDYLRPKTEIRLPKNAEIVLTSFGSDQSYRLTGPGRAMIEAGGVKTLEGPAAELIPQPANQRKVARAITPGQLQALKIANVRLREVQENAFLPVAPVEGTILATRPEFSWRAPDGCGSYFLEVSREGGKSVYAGKVDSNRAALPPGVSLARGAAYLWQVKCEGPSATSRTAQARFRVAGASEASAVLDLAPAKGGSFSERLTYAAMLQLKGYLYDAGEIWKSLALERPDSDLLDDLASRH